MIEVTRARPFTSAIDRVRQGEATDWLVAAVVISLPWSTSATAILIVLWLLAIIPSLDVISVRREVMSPAGGLPVLLWVLAALAMLWAEVGWYERIQGLRGFHKLLIIPLLLAQFRRSQRANLAILGFFVSAVILLGLSWLTWYAGFWGREKAEIGVPVKDYMAQSGIFAICAFGLWAQAVQWGRIRQTHLALAAAFLAAGFIANIVFVANARTTLVVIAVLLLLLGLREFGWKGMLVVGLVGSMLASLLWASSPLLRLRVNLIAGEVQDYRAGKTWSSVGLRFEFWKNSTEFIAAAPLVGHGTGTIEALARRHPVSPTGTEPMIQGNPHNQILAVAIQLGVSGAILLIAMWIVHLALFREGTSIASFGLTIVVSNIVSSLFNSHLFDFTQGWLYVFGVGILGGTLLGRKQAKISLGAAGDKGHH
jgi:O-antigen ligase